MFWLMTAVFAVIATILEYILHLILHSSGSFLGLGYIYFAFILFTLIPMLSVIVRRLHDVGKSGWMFFIAFIPGIGSIWMLVQMCKDGQPGVNKYGVNPKGGLVEGSEIF